MAARWVQRVLEKCWRLSLMMHHEVTGNLAESSPEFCRAPCEVVFLHPGGAARALLPVGSQPRPHPHRARLCAAPVLREARTGGSALPTRGTFTDLRETQFL